MKKKRIARTITLGGSVLFTTIVLFLGTSILLDLFGIWEQQGHYVPFLCLGVYIATKSQL